MSSRRAHYRHIAISTVLFAIGLGAVSSMFTVLRVLSLSGLPYPHADRLVVARVGGPSWSPAMLEAVASSSTVLEETVGFQERAATVAGTETAEIVRLESVSASYFHLLGAQPSHGRVFTSDEDRRNGSVPIAVISDAFWRRRFGRDAAIVGRQVTVDGRSLEIIGVMPPAFRGLIGRTDVWTPLGSARWLTGDTGPERPSSRWFEVLARRRADMTSAVAQSRFAVEARAAIEQTPGGDRIVGPTTTLTLVPLAEARVSSVVARGARVLATAAAIALLLVIGNATSLHLVRVDARTRELAIRSALGSTPRHFALMAVREAGTIAALSTLGGLILRPILLSALDVIQPASASFGIVTATILTADAYALDAPTVLLTLTMAVLCAAPLALAVMLKARRIGLDPMARGSMTPMGLSRGARTGRTVLIGAQAVLACAIVGGGALLTRSASQLLARDRGYEIDHVMTARVSLPNTYDDGRAAEFYGEFVSRLRATPGITHASISSCAPGGGRCRRSNLSHIDGQALDPATAPTVGISYVTPMHFETIGAHIVAGRSIEDVDRPGTNRVVVISEPLARALWPGVDPIGRTVAIFTANGSLNGPRTVVGVVKPIAFNLEADPGLDVFLPAAQASWTSGVVFVRGPLPPEVLARTISMTVTSVDRAVAVNEAAGLGVPLARSLAVESFLRRTLLAFGIAGLLLAALGTYAVTQHAVAESRRELGIRVALGAAPRQIRLLVARRGALIAIIGAVAGGIGAAWSGTLLRSFLHGLAPTDGLGLIAGPLATVIAILAAIAGPAIRATRLNPVVALRVQ